MTVIATHASIVPRRRRAPRRRPTPVFSTPLLAMFSRTAEASLRQTDPAVRLTLAANLCESLAKSEPAAFERMSADALRWPNRFVLCVLADLSASFRRQDPAADPSVALAQSVHVVELWFEAVRGAYTDRDALAQDRERARLAMRILRQQALDRCAAEAGRA